MQRAVRASHRAQELAEQGRVVQSPERRLRIHLVVGEDPLRASHLTVPRVIARQLRVGLEEKDVVGPGAEEGVSLARQRLGQRVVDRGPMQELRENESPFLLERSRAPLAEGSVREGVPHEVDDPIQAPMFEHRRGAAG